MKPSHFKSNIQRKRSTQTNFFIPNHFHRSKEHQEEKLKPFDWTFSTDYQGSINEKIIVEKTDLKIDRFKLMVKENILFYADITLFEDELHDHGISQLSVKIVSTGQ